MLHITWIDTRVTEAWVKISAAPNSYTSVFIWTQWLSGT